MCKRNKWALIFQSCCWNISKCCPIRKKPHAKPDLYIELYTIHTQSLTQSDPTKSFVLSRTWAELDFKKYNFEVLWDIWIFQLSFENCSTLSVSFERTSSEIFTNASFYFPCTYLSIYKDIQGMFRNLQNCMNYKTSFKDLLSY